MPPRSKSKFLFRRFLVLYDEEIRHDWYVTYHKNSWTTSDSNFLRRLVALCYYPTEDDGIRMAYDKVDAILVCMFKKEGVPPCIRKARAVGHDCMSMFAAKRVYQLAKAKEEKRL